MIIKNFYNLPIILVSTFCFSQNTNIFPTNGNVGIGTINPDALLHVNGDIKTNHSFIFGNSLIKYDQGGAVVLKASTATATPYIDFNRFGETGYFTSRLTLLAPQVYTNNEPKLTLLGSTLTLPHGVEFLNSPWGNGFGAKIYGTDDQNGTTSLRFGIRHNTHSYTDAIVIKTESGNVGIGTENPTEKLQIGNSFIFHPSEQHDAIGFGYIPSTNSDMNANTYSAELRFKKDSGSLSLGISSDGTSNPTTAFEIWKNNNVTMSYYDWGKVGIGTNNPTEKLQVQGNIKSIGDINSYRLNNDIGGKIGFETYDAFLINSQKVAHYGMSKYSNENSQPTLALSGYFGTTFHTNGGERMRITQDGKIGIGTKSPDAKLTVNGDIHAKEVKIDLAIAPDYVFEKYYDGYSTLKSDYKMPTLQEIEAFTKENKHLPEVPSSKEIKENGLKLGEMNAILLQKVEELTLYLIEQNKEIEKLKTKVDELSKK